MSLLLEALKKAEKAKEDAQRRAKGEPAAAELRIESEPAVPEKPVLTRAELPDIRQPLEILSDEIAPRPAEEPSQAQDFGEAQAADRATARKVFEAKFREPNPRLPFHIALGTLAVAAIGIVVYFWYQLQPPPPLVNLNPARGGAQQAVAPAAAPESRPSAVTAASAAPASIPGLPPLAAAPASAPEPKERLPREAAPVAPQPALRAAAPPAPRVREHAPRVAAPAPQSQPRLTEAPLTQSRQAPQIDPKVASGYAAYLAGDLATAHTDYQAALREDAGNRDALLGLAATDVRAGRYEAAEAAYLRLLQNDPTDANAQAGLIALRASRLDPLATESRVKNLLAADPGANVLHFTLGNQLAQQGRWAEAQQAYFKAMAADPDNADFAFNLAVSLDHLRQSKLAADYYRRAIALAEKRGASFDLAAARTRAAQLGN
ncbi:MAG TPA: tetratricopeptide repeat protein [Burkholderiales bacterium]|jgi:tetratricopeptide (TPR) repeat protein